ncbi:hypothetical protein ACE1CB_07400 [Aerosakkonema sp. BLCC-F2]
MEEFGGRTVSYYDFDDHFWSPKEVCGQQPPKRTQKRIWGIWKLTGIGGGGVLPKYGSISADLKESLDRTPQA